MRDVVVIGAGHNSLVAACYLAREGLDVEIVERDTVVGGAVSTVERFPGYRVDRGASAHIMVRHTGIIEDLRLAEVGLAYEDLDPWGFAPFGEQALTFWVDLDRTCDSIAAMCGERDAAAYRAFVTLWRTRNERVFAAFQAPPTPRHLGRALWPLGGPGMETAREFLQPGDALLDAAFSDERLKTALSWFGAQAGPPAHEVGTADLVGWIAMLHVRPPGYPVGGSGMLTRALADRFAAYGGRLRPGDGVARITSDNGRVTGVVTDGGAAIQARTVLAGCHVLTMLELLGDAALLADAQRRIRIGNGIGMVVRLGTSDLPRYPAATPQTYRALQLIVRSRSALRSAYGDYSAGLPPRAPAVVAMTFSAFDDTLAPPGRHSISLWGQWHPYALSNGERWADIGEREGAKLVEAVDAVAPGFAATVERMHVQTPPDLERELGLRRGNVMHVEMGLDAMFGWRPLPEWSAYRGPYQGLYLTGASTHPGGGVFGASGRSAARVLLTDCANRPRWRPRSRRRGPWRR